MIDVLKRLAELDANNPRVVNPMVPQVKDSVITEGQEIKLPEMAEPEIGDLKALSGVKKLTESTIAECGMMPMGAPMPTMPASLNMSAGNAGEIVAMMRGIMDLAKGDVASQSMMPTMGAPMPKMMGDLDRDGDHDMDDHDLEEPDGVLTGGPAVSGPTFGDDEPGSIDDGGGDELASMLKKLNTGEPVKISTDMPVKVTSDEPIKGSTTDRLNTRDDSKPDEGYDNSPADPTKPPKFDPNSMADMRNKIDMAEIPPGAPGDNKLPKKKEESSDPLAAFESKLFADYKKFVAEGPKPEDVPAFIRKSKEPGKAANKEANDKRNEKVGAKVFSSPRK